MAAVKSMIQNLSKHIKKPWEFTGPCSHPEYINAVPNAVDYRQNCPATVPDKAIVPTSDPETVFDIKYHSRDLRRNRPPVRRYVYKKADVEKMMAETKFVEAEFPRVYLTDTVVEDMDTHGGGYQK